MERKKISLLILGICVLALSVVGLTYAFWMLKFSQTEEDKLSSSCFHVTFSEEEQSAIRIEKAYPILDEEGVTLKPYTFTITNTCNENAGYQINLESLSKSGEITIPENDRLKAKYVKLKINEENQEGSISILGDNDVVKTTLKDAYDSHKLMTGYLGPTETKSFELRLWLDGAITMEDTEAMNKTFASKITVTASYLKEELIPPTVDLELAVCENNIIARGTGKANAEKQISKYEFQLDDQEWTSNDMESIQRFSDLKTGNHTIRFRVTDDKGVTNETLRTVEVNYKEPTLATIGGKTIPLVTEGNGLYKVSHCDVTGTMDDLGFSQEEYRYAGIDYDEISQPTDYVHNYVNFNDEKWRIIGLVNVKTSDDTIEQRLKIIRDDSIGNFSWDHKTSGTGSSTSEYGSNDWTDSQLMELLNDGYYHSSSNVSCFKGSSSPKTCNFSGTDTGTKGLEVSARNMIDENIIWNIGGIGSEYNSLKANDFYKKERGTTGGGAALATTEWPKPEGKTYIAGKALVGLMYPSDYGYASSGSNHGKTRSECVKDTVLYSYNTNSYCYEKDWLYLGPTEWLLSPFSNFSNLALYVASEGYVTGYYQVTSSYAVRPVVYLKPSVQIVNDDNDGSYDRPYNLTLLS